MSNSSSIIGPSSVTKTRGAQKRGAAEPIESELPVKLTSVAEPSAILQPSAIVQPKENPNDVLVSSFFVF